MMNKKAVLNFGSGGGASAAQSTRVQYCRDTPSWVENKKEKGVLETKVNENRKERLLRVAFSNF